MLRKYSFVLGLTIVIAILLPVIGAYETAAQQWPWGSKEEPYPWLDYLANLTTVRNIRLVVLTRHESSIQSLTRILFLNSPVAAKLGITELQFVYQEASLWPETIRRAMRLGTSIDVAWGGGPTLFNMLDEMGFLLPINPTVQPEHYAIMYELSKIPEIIAGSATYKVDARGNIRWIGASVSSFGFTVNKLILERYGLPKPLSWEDLTNHVYIKYYPAARLMGLADPTKSTSNLRIFEIILQARGWNEGWRILTLMAANSIVYPGSGEVRDAVIRGDIAIGTTIDFYGYMAMSVNPYCEYIAPEGETIVNADPIAIINITKYPVHAAAFVAWVLSEFGGQLVWLHGDINRIPVNPRTFEIEIPEELKAYGITSRPDLKQAFDNLVYLRGIEFDEALSASWINSVMYYFKATLVNAHEDLQYVWSEISKAYLEGKITHGQFQYLIHELTRPLRFVDPMTRTEVEFTLEYAIKVNKALTDAATYQALMSTWEQAARERYRKVLEILRSGNIPEYPPPATTGTVTETTPLTTSPVATETSAGTETPSTVQPGGVSPTLIALVAIAIAIVGALVVLVRRK
ncbi:MAG: ABC transporter substrate-binding protein [Desulfurococcaceae archaeon]